MRRNSRSRWTRARYEICGAQGSACAGAAAEMAVEPAARMLKMIRFMVFLLVESQTSAAAGIFVFAMIRNLLRHRPRFPQAALDAHGQPRHSLGDQLRRPVGEIEPQSVALRVRGKEGRAGHEGHP